MRRLNVLQLVLGFRLERSELSKWLEEAACCAARVLVVWRLAALASWSWQSVCWWLVIFWARSSRSVGVGRAGFVKLGFIGGALAACQSKVAQPWLACYLPIHLVL